MAIIRALDGLIVLTKEQSPRSYQARGFLLYASYRHLPELSVPFTTFMRSGLVSQDGEFKPLVRRP